MSAAVDRRARYEVRLTYGDREVTAGWYEFWHEAEQRRNQYVALAQMQPGQVWSNPRVVEIVR